MVKGIFSLKGWIAIEKFLSHKSHKALSQKPRFKFHLQSIYFDPCCAQQNEKKKFSVAFFLGQFQVGPDKKKKMSRIIFACWYNVFFFYLLYRRLIYEQPSARISCSYICS